MLKAIVICSNGVKEDSEMVLSILRKKGMKVRNVFMFQYEVKGIYIDFKKEISAHGTSADIVVHVNKNLGNNEGINLLRESITLKSKFRGKNKLSTVEDLIWFIDTRLSGMDDEEEVIEDTPEEELHEVVLEVFSSSEVAQDKGECLVKLIMKCNELLWEKVYIRSLDMTITFVSWNCQYNRVKEDIEVKLEFSESRGKK